MIARQEIFLCETCVRPQVTRFRYQRSPVGSICGPLAELGRRSCGAGVSGWLNATVPPSSLGVLAVHLVKQRLPLERQIQCQLCVARSHAAITSVC